MKVYLGIDTATANLVLGLYSAEKGLLGTYENGLEPHATKQIIPQLDKLLAQSKLKKADIAGITVGIGPGSYTGIKVAIATAKGLARGLDIPLQGKSTLAAMAFAELKNHETAVVCIDARRDNVYYAVFEKHGKKIQALSIEAKENLAVVKNKYQSQRVILNASPSAEYLASFTNFANKEVLANYL